MNRKRRKILNALRKREKQVDDEATLHETPQAESPPLVVKENFILEPVERVVTENQPSTSITTFELPGTLPTCMEEVLSEICNPHLMTPKIYVSGREGTQVVSQSDFEASEVKWRAEKELSYSQSISPVGSLPALELRTRRPVTQLVPILPMLRWGSMPEEPESQLLECESRKELTLTLAPSFNQCIAFDVPMSLVVVALPDLTETSYENELSNCDVQMEQIIDEIFAAIREHGMLVRFNKSFLALFLLRMDQLTAGKVCQRIKESVRRLAYFKLHLPFEPQLKFGVSEHLPGQHGDAEKLVREALHNMDLAEHLGEGAIVREVDKDLSLEREHQDAHFTLGDIWLKQLSKRQEEHH